MSSFPVVRRRRRGWFRLLALRTQSDVGRVRSMPGGSNGLMANFPPITRRSVCPSSGRSRNSYDGSVQRAHRVWRARQGSNLRPPLRRSPIARQPRQELTLSAFEFGGGSQRVAAHRRRTTETPPLRTEAPLLRSLRVATPLEQVCGSYPASRFKPVPRPRSPTDDHRISISPMTEGLFLFTTIHSLRLDEGLLSASWAVTSNSARHLADRPDCSACSNCSYPWRSSDSASR
jgi:hypothetical protein